MTSSGRDSPFVTSGEVFDTTQNDPLTGGDRSLATGDVDVILTDLRRASIHAAIGHYFRPIQGQTNYDLLFSFRFGGRLGHANANFEKEFSAEVTQGVNDGLAEGLRRQDINVVADRDYAETDTFGGIFLGIETVFARQDIMGGDLSLILDTEFANDWINLENVNKAGLPTISFMLGLTLRR